MAIMMRMLLVGTLVPTFAAALLAAQTGSTSSQEKKPASTPAPKTLSLVGCVGGTGAPGNPYTLSDPKEGIAYRLTGTNMKRYVGQRVEILGGTDQKRLKIVGGLTPSPNVAAQAGAMDPTRAAVAADPLSTTGKSDQPLPEFRVRTVRPLGKSCE